MSPQDGANGLHKDYNCSCPGGSCDWACTDGKIDYRPAQAFLDANFTDLCYAQGAGTAGTCVGSYPTQVYSQPYAAVRIDFMMATDDDFEVRSHSSKRCVGANR